MEYDRRGKWNERIQKGKNQSFVRGYLEAMRFTHWGYLKFSPVPETDYQKGRNAGITKRKEKEMEALLTGVPYVSPGHELIWKEEAFLMGGDLIEMIDKLIEAQANQQRGK